MGDLRTQKTYASLKKAFLELLEKYRFEDITVIQLCEQAGIRRATFYTHFADKYEYLSFFIQEIRRDMLAESDQEWDTKQKDAHSTATSNLVNDYYDILFHKMILFFENHPKIVTNLTHSQMLPTMMEIFTNDIQRYVYSYLKEHRTDCDDVLLEMKTHFYAGGITQLVKLWITAPEKYPVDSINWLHYLL